MEGNQRNKVAGKLVVITGAGGSMGSAAVRAMAAEGWSVVMACRNLEKGAAVRESVLKEIPSADIVLMHLDLVSQAGVRSFVADLKELLESRGCRISALFNNAGAMPRRFSLTEDGIVQTMAVNYLDTVLLTRLLTGSMEPGGHIVNMVSLTASLSRLDLGWTEMGEKDFSQLGTYGKSKLALLLFTCALAKRFPDLKVNAADPGIVNSGIITMDRWFDPLADVLFRPFISSPEKGVAPAIAALHADAGMRYYAGNRFRPMPGRFSDDPLADALWDQASCLLGLK